MDRATRRHRAAGPQDVQGLQTFKGYEPGFVHADIKHLPKLPEESPRRYLYITIDRAIRWVYFEVRANRRLQRAATFMRELIQAATSCTCIRMTDRAFTDQLNRLGQAPSGNYPVDRLCLDQGIVHRLPPRHPQTNGLVKQFNIQITASLA